MPWFIPRRLLRAPDSRVTDIDDQAATLEIAGLFCAVCANRVSNSLRKVDGVSSASCDLKSATATVQLSRPVSDEALRQAVLDAATAKPIRRAVERAARLIGA